MLCRKHGISDATLYQWRAKCAGLEISDVKTLPQLEDENRRLEQMVAEEVLELQALNAVATTTGRAQGETNGGNLGAVETGRQHARGSEGVVGLVVGGCEQILGVGVRRNALLCPATGASPFFERGSCGVGSARHRPQCYAPLF